LAYLSPLPPDQSGIADYSAHLIAELGRYYTITVVAQSAVSDPWVLANCAIRSIDWFDAHADRFERIVYHFGNSSFHGHMFALLARHPGLVVLHDFYLSGIVNYLDNTGQQPGAFEQALFHSHGYGALLMAQQQGREAALWAHPCNLKVLQDAAGVIVHSQYARELAARWYGARLADDWLVMPFPRAAEAGDRAAARARLGVPEGDYLTCSFGLLGSTKRNHVLLAAWLASSLADDPACQLVFVGENASGPYGEQLRQAIAASGRAARIKITGFASPALYRDYLAAADSAVQLRGTSRGETSAAIMDCMAHALPLIINANGAAADIGADLVLRLPDDFAPAQLSEALDALRRQPAQAAAMAARAAAHIHALHHPYAVGMRYRDAIEQVCRTSASAAETALLRSCAAQPTPPAPGDLIEVARCVARNRRGRGAQRQLLVDVSELAQRDAKSGIQRVVRNIVGALLREPPPGFRVEPIYEQDGRYRYARRFTCALLGLDAGALDDDDIGFAPGDRYLGLDLLPHTVPRNAHLFEDWRNAGVEIHFVVYDLLPLLRPDVFVPHADEGHRRWLASTVAVADGLMCISRAVADEVAGWLATADLPARAPLGIGYFHLGADLEAARTPAVPTAQEQAILARIEGAPSVLMVGTLEPRKGYAQALDAFELLWAAGQQVTLVIVGKNGWMVEALVKRLASHPERAARLVWLDSASDSLLLQLYQHASALLAASEAEGFGLPLIEAAQHGLPIIARDLPVFREVAGEHASYFSGAGAADLAACLTRWLAVHAQGQAPASAGMPWLTWADSARQLMRRIDHGAWYRHWPAGAGAPTPYCDGTDDTRRQR
ncbi:MAG: glycosyltransferase, partial [Massilia sp.]